MLFNRALMVTVQFLPAEFAMTPTAASLRGVALILDQNHASPVDLTTFISCYNERSYVIDTLDTARAALAEVGNIAYEIIVIDNCSTDGSSDMIEGYMRRHVEDHIVLRRKQIQSRSRPKLP